ncbi:YaeQ family protein [Microbacterium sp. NPDC028030]|uniref:YaeQ family protein n=1 Tax=Microbacterium sp. NPDC028030 TaxID=3155124 RepID=UPI0033CA1E09
MAIGSTVHTFEVQLADTDRGVYEDYSLRVARHPSETDAYMLTRVLAYGLEFGEGIAFGGSISSTEEPAVLVRDLTGLITAWVEIGAPDAERLHYGSRLAERTVVYTHRDPAKVIAPWADKRIHRREDIRVHSFDPGFIDTAAALIERRNTMTLTVTEGVIYLDLNGTNLTSTVHVHELPA